MDDDEGPTTVVVVSDTHINSTIGLCPPVVNKDDGGSYRSSPGQRFLWRSWLEMWEAVSDISGRKVLVLNGDIGELDSKKRSHQIVTRNQATIQRMIADTLAPALDVCGDVYVIRGTPAHTGKSAWLDEAVAEDVGAIGPPEDGFSWWHLRVVCEGVKFDIAHHASMGRLPWTMPNSANKLAFLARTYYFEMGQKPPDVVIRSHQHRYADSGGNYDTFAVYSPAWQLKTEYINRLGGENQIADIGSLAFTCKDGRYQMERYKYRLRERAWKMKM